MQSAGTAGRTLFGIDAILPDVYPERRQFFYVRKDLLK
jgi:hypothetical protein